MPVASSDILRLAIRHKWQTIDDMVNVMHFRVGVIPDPNTDANLLADIAEKIGSAWLEIESLLSNNVTAEDITVYNVTQDGPIGVTSFGAGYTGGTGTGESMPPADCMLVLRPTAIKRTQGRFYLSGFTEAQQNAGQWTVGAIANVGQLVSVLDDLTPLTMNTVLNYQVYKRNTGVMVEPTTTRIQARTAYQLRRKPGRGS